MLSFVLFLPFSAYAELAEVDEGSQIEDSQDRTIRDLADRLNPPGSDERINEIRELIRHGGTSPVDHLLSVIETDPDPEVRAWAVRGVGELVAPGIRRKRMLRAASQSDPDIRVRSMASEIRRQSVPGAVYRITGWILFTIPYLFFVGLASESWQVALPIIGPGWAAETGFKDDGAMRWMLWLMDFGFQIAALPLIIVGSVIRSRDRQQYRRRRRSGGLASFIVTPTPIAQGGGLTVSGWF